jgi:hypothetical protein
VGGVARGPPGTRARAVPAHNRAGLHAHASTGLAGAGRHGALGADRLQSDLADRASAYQDGITGCGIGSGGGPVSECGRLCHGTGLHVRATACRIALPSRYFTNGLDAMSRSPQVFNFTAARDPGGLGVPLQFGGIGGL